MNPILALDFAGVAVFAATGALAASRKQLDIIGFLFLATITGVGGGTVQGTGQMGGDEAALGRHGFCSIGFCARLPLCD